MGASRFGDPRGGMGPPSAQRPIDSSDRPCGVPSPKTARNVTLGIFVFSDSSGRGCGRIDVLCGQIMLGHLAPSTSPFRR